MASKKYSLLAGVLSLFAVSAAQAQTSTNTVYRGSGYDVLDTSLIPSSRMDQQRDFLNRNYDYPSKPRNQWELGFGVGLLNVSGDVRSKSFYNRPLKGNTLNTMAWNVTLRKAWGYVISTRLQYIQGAAHGYNWQQTQSFYQQGANPYNELYKNATATGGAPSVNFAYKTQVRELTLQMLASLNNIKFHRARNKMSVYGMFGFGGLLYATYNDIFDASGNGKTNPYNWASFTDTTTQIGGSNSPLWQSYYKTTRTSIEKRIVAAFDGDFETAAERHDNRYYFNDKYTFRPVATVGMGIQFRLGKRVSLGIEEKVTFTNDDLIDGQRWQEPNRGIGAGGQINTLVQSDMTRDFDNINYLSVNLGINLGNKSVAPLWWLNPMDFAYNELTAPRRLKVGAQVNECDKDDDGDGVSNCFDKCPDTPLGVAVDTKGCCLDTDGDGVCDYKDKQLITPTECQPVDADGIGKCPDPACCKDRPKTEACGGMHDGSIAFAPNNTKLSGAAMSELSSLAAQMKANPTCNVIIAGNGDGKLEQQRSWVRANAVLNYMNSQGVDRDRFIFQYGNGGAANTVDYRLAAPGQMGGSVPPPPHPNLK
jgi:OmpA-OmpF porin, OOP family